VSVAAAVNLDDLRKLARRRLPRIAFDFIEGGVEDEVGLDRNTEAFRQIKLVPRFLAADVTKRDQTISLFGRAYSGPVGIAPTGIAGFFRRGADMMLAEAARDANVPFIMSGAATASIEELGRTCREHGWYQLYVAQDRRISEDMIRRVADAGLSTLVLTIDVPVNSKRERNVRNGFTRPYKVSWTNRFEALLHPAWMYEYLTFGVPMQSNWQRYAPADATADQVLEFQSRVFPTPVVMSDVAMCRRLFPGKVVVKGVMDPGDAIRAVEAGVDGVIVSNHGGRQLDRSPAPIEVLPAVAAAVGTRTTVMFDSGIRRGADVVTALCLGAKYVFQGRNTLYGVTAAGKAGATRALDILRDEIDRTLVHIGAPDLASLGPHCIWRGGAAPADGALRSDRLAVVRG
jgi:L-lactate dehydrogenase (cytochrome)/(S)-mandelate dehydrogenase